MNDPGLLAGPAVSGLPAWPWLVAVLAVLAVLLGEVVWRRSLRVVWSMVASARWWQPVVGLAAAAVTGTVGLVLASRVPALSWSWWQQVWPEGDDGAGAAGPVGSTVSEAARAVADPDVAAAAGWPGPVVVLVAALAVVVGVLLVAALPAIVLAEELTFRRGAEAGGPRRWAGSAVVFGAAHVALGVPAYAGVALAGFGLGLAVMYAARWWLVHAGPVGLAGAQVGESVTPVADWEATQAVVVAHLVHNLALLAAVGVLFLRS